MTYPHDFDIVWSGGPLLPPRRSKPPRWWTMGAGHALVEQDPKEAARLREAIRPKRAYHRKTAPVQPPSGVTCRGEDMTDGRTSTLQSGPVAPVGQPATSGDGAGGHGPESLQTLTHPQTPTITE